MTKGDYEVGRGKPPKHTQFKPGQSGNPKGGKKLVKSLTDLVREECNSMVTANLPGGGTMKITKGAAIVKQLFTAAMKGDARSARLVMELLKTLNLSEVESEQVITDQQMTELLALAAEYKE